MVRPAPVNALMHILGNEQGFYINWQSEGYKPTKTQSTYRMNKYKAKEGIGYANIFYFVVIFIKKKNIDLKTWVDILCFCMTNSFFLVFFLCQYLFL